ncbi:hypothetical protein DFH28DRAFT_396928 [Melampsora americana]|nr:hypothetical protein DFH28DRAFT_396928 [Melampsora americana]
MMTKNIWAEQFKSSGAYTNSYMKLAAGHKEYLYNGAKFLMPFASGPPSKRTKANAGDPDPPQRKNVKTSAPRAPVVKDGEDCDYEIQDDIDYEFEDDIPIEKPHPIPVTRGTAKRVKSNTNHVDPADSYKALLALRDKVRKIVMSGLIADLRLGFGLFQIQSIADGNMNDAIPTEIIQVIACLNPTTQKALLEIEGIDKDFVKTYGAATLKICRQSIKHNQATATEIEDTSSNAPSSKTPTGKFNEQIRRFAAPPSTTRSKSIKRPPVPSSSRSVIRAMPMPK